MSEEHILELARTHLDECEIEMLMVGNKAQIIKFAQAIYEMGYENGASENGGYY